MSESKDTSMQDVSEITTKKEDSNELERAPSRETTSAEAASSSSKPLPVGIVPPNKSSTAATQDIISKLNERERERERRANNA